MAKAKEGDLYSCGECGLVVCVEDPCGCSTCEMICCDVPMTKKAGKAKNSKKEESRTEDQGWQKIGDRPLDHFSHRLTYNPGRGAKAPLLPITKAASTAGIFSGTVPAAGHCRPLIPFSYIKS